MHVVTTRRVYQDKVYETYLLPRASSGVNPSPSLVYQDKVYETYLLRRTYRDEGKVKNEAVANLSHLPPAALEAIRQILRGEELVPTSAAIRITRSLRHGDSAAVVGLVRRLGLEELLGPACGERTIALGLIVVQVLALFQGRCDPVVR